MLGSLTHRKRAVMSPEHVCHRVWVTPETNSEEDKINMSAISAAVLQEQASGVVLTAREPMTIKGKGVLAVCLPP